MANDIELVLKIHPDFIFDDKHIANVIRKQIKIYLSSIWRCMTKAITEDRNIDVAMLNRLADSLTIRTAADAKAEIEKEHLGKWYSTYSTFKKLTEKKQVLAQMPYQIMIE